MEMDYKSLDIYDSDFKTKEGAIVESNRILAGSVRCDCRVAYIRRGSARSGCANAIARATPVASATATTQSHGIQPASGQARESRGALQNAHRPLSLRLGLR